MTTHELKTWPQPFKAVRLGDKRHEIRTNDRDYQRGDRVVLLEYSPTDGTYTGGRITAIIGHVTHGGEWGIPDGLCVFTLLEVLVKAVGKAEN